VAAEAGPPDDPAPKFSLSLSLVVTTRVARGAGRALDQLSPLMLCLLRDKTAYGAEERKLPQETSVINY